MSLADSINEYTRTESGKAWVKLRETISLNRTVPIFPCPRYIFSIFKRISHEFQKLGTFHINYWCYSTGYPGYTGFQWAWTAKYTDRTIFNNRWRSNSVDLRCWLRKAHRCGVKKETYALTVQRHPKRRYGKAIQKRILGQQACRDLRWYSLRSTSVQFNR